MNLNCNLILSLQYNCNKHESILSITGFKATVARNWTHFYFSSLGDLEQFDADADPDPTLNVDPY